MDAYEAARMERAAAADKERQAEYKRERFAARMAKANIPAHGGLLLAASNDAPLQTDALTAIQNAARWRAARIQEIAARAKAAGLGGFDTPSWPLFLFLSGPPDSSKSTSMAWMVLRYTRASHFVEATDIATTPEGHSSSDAFWELIYGIDLLAIDELGLENDPGEKLARVIVSRYTHGLFTIGAGNLSRQAFLTRYGGGANSRMISRLDAEQGRVDGGLPWFVQLKACGFRGAMPEIAAQVA